jgi:hypothetical protein
VLAAIHDGFRRTASAPAVLLGTLALTFLFALDRYMSDVSVRTQSGAVLAVLPVAHWLEPAWVVIWAFLSGGILDRYARNRPTRGRGFFGACGAHFPAMIRLGVLQWLVLIMALKAAAGLNWQYVDVVASVAADLFFLYARVRIVVEDRRSAIGALLAGGRFILRNAAAASIYLILAAVMWLGLELARPILFGAGERTLARLAGSEIILALLLLLVFASWASATSFFQARLAHASYTAGPPLEWPESPAAEAISNLSRSAHP